MARAKKIGELRDAGTSQTLMQMFVPRAEDDPLSICLRMLTHQLKLKLGKAIHAEGFFGGTFGYGEDFENDVFEMRN